MKNTQIYTSLLLPTFALSQSIASLTNALANYTNTKQFSTYLNTNPTAFTTLLSSSPAAPGGGLTILIPSDSAISTSGLSLTSLTPETLAPILSYHVLAAPLTGTNFTQAKGITVPTLLKDALYNNRSGGAQLESQFGKQAAQGQVLFFSSDPIPTTKKFRVRVRQAGQGGANVRAGQSEVANVDIVDGTWDGGRFQIVDSILKPPAPCSSTIRPVTQLSALDAALNKTGLWDTLDHAPNVTCLAPNTKAFGDAGNPQDKLSQADLQAALLFHTLPMPLYTNYLTNGQKITSLGNLTVEITVNATGTYFNDARVIAQNVLTNNGVIHILDKVMSPLKDAATPSGTATGGASTPSPTKGAANELGANGFAVGLVALFAALLA